MKAFHEECLRLSAKALQSQLNAQDVNAASLWFGMVGQHFLETNFDSAIRTVAVKTLNQMQMTGAPLDYTPLESELSKELSTRVGRDVEGEIHPEFVSSFEEDIRRLRYLSTSGLSSLFIEVGKALAQGFSALPTDASKRNRPSKMLHVIYPNSLIQQPNYPQARLLPVSPILPPTICQTILQGSEITGGAGAFILVICADLGPLAMILYPQLCVAGGALGAAGGLLLLLHGFACY